MQDYQGNSDKAKKAAGDKPVPEKKMEKVVKGEVIVKPPSISSKFKRIFFGGDMNTAGQYVMSEVLLPALRNLLVETISTGADRLIYGDSGRRRRSSGPTYSPRVQYNNPTYRDPMGISRSYPTDRSPRASWPRSQGRDLENIIVSSKIEADEVIDRLSEAVDMYEMVSLADFYELVGLPSAHVDHKFGWTNLRHIESRQVRDGYKIVLPPLEEIS